MGSGGAHGGPRTQTIAFVDWVFGSRNLNGAHDEVAHYDRGRIGWH